jgi:hypothetical protein
MKSIVYIILVMLFINGCSILSGGSEEGSQECIDGSLYLSEGNSDLLLVPPDLSPYDYNNALIIPESIGANNQQSQPCLEIPPTL